MGPEADGIGIVYLGTFSRVLATTLTASPHLRDPSRLQREEIKTAVLDQFQCCTACDVYPVNYVKACPAEFVF